ncbi:MAG: N-6 DNA methylase [Helcococcus sp.]|nr:N-6 DNA methylase [Helcococcus sp.]
MDIKDFFDNELKIKESYQLPDALLNVLLSDRKNELLSKYIDLGLNTDVDIFNAYFEQRHSDRKNLMQDFTPSSITGLISKLEKYNESILDVCAGVGGLSKNLKSEITYLEEISTRAIPLLLFSLSIKNENAIVKNGDVLTGEYSKIYKLTKGERFSDIEVVESVEDIKFDLIVSNPPYSQKWEPRDVIDISRYMEYETAPRSKADWAFVIGQLNRLKEDGKMFFILPHGVLFRGGAEEKIRKKMIQNNLIDMVISLPPKMFANTDIPTVLLVFKKNRKSEQILFINAEKEFIEQNKRNVFSENNLNKILSTINNKLEVKRFSYLASLEEVIENECNLNVTRYVDTYVPEPLPNLIEILNSIFDQNDEIKKTERAFFKMVFDLYGTTESKDKELLEAKKIIKERYGEIE